jgi:uncharacterized protein YbaR (Trm112 family)
VTGPESYGSPVEPPAVDRRMLEFLVCPVTRGPLDYDPDRRELVSHGARLAFPIRDGIPVMLVEEARRLD